MSRFCVRWFTVWPSCQVALHLAVSCSQKVSIFSSLSYSIANPIHWIGVENGQNILFSGLLVALLEMSLCTIWNEFQLCFWIWGCIAGCSMASWYMDILHCTFPFPLWCHLCRSLPPYATGWRKVLYSLLACFLFLRYWFPVMLLAPNAIQLIVVALEYKCNHIEHDELTQPSPWLMSNPFMNVETLSDVTNKGNMTSKNW